MKFKKSFVLTDTMIYILIGVFVFLILVFVVPRLLGGSTSEAKGLLSSTKDYDNDGVSDFFDKCVCKYGDVDGCQASDLNGKSPKELSQLKYSGCQGNEKPNYDVSKSSSANVNQQQGAK